MIEKPKVIRIDNEVWSTHKKHLSIELREPYWTAARKFGWWGTSFDGFSISNNGIDKAEELGLLLGIHCLALEKYYEISPDDARTVGSQHIIHGHKMLCIPRSSTVEL